MPRQREKACHICAQAAPTLFRVQLDAAQTWQFICSTCHTHVSQNNPFYRYGGTWKAQKP
jgi:hypothetical protein